MFELNEKFKYLPTPIVNFAPDGASNQNWQAAFSEVLDSYKEYIGLDYKIYIGLFKQHLYYRLINTKFGKWLLALKAK